MAAKPEQSLPRRKRRTNFERECERCYPLNLWETVVAGLPLIVLGIGLPAFFWACLFGLVWLGRASGHPPLTVNQGAGLVVLCLPIAWIIPYLAGFWLFSPWVRVRSRRALRRRGAPICIRCAYDMTGIDSAVCPECGRDHITPPGRTES